MKIELNDEQVILIKEGLVKLKEDLSNLLVTMSNANYSKEINEYYENLLKKQIKIEKLIDFIRCCEKIGE